MSAKGVSTTAASVVAASSAPSRGKLASLYYFADGTDHALIFTGCLFKLAFGATQGFVIVIFGDFFDVSPDKFEDAGVFFMSMMAILGAPWLGLGLESGMAILGEEHRTRSLIHRRPWCGGRGGGRRGAGAGAGA